MLTKRRIKPAKQTDPTIIPDTPIPPKLTIRLKKVFLGPKHIREMQPWTFDLPQGRHWDWKLWVDAAGKEFASVKHGRNTVWYSVQHLETDHHSVGTIRGLDTIPQGMRLCIYRQQEFRNGL